MSMHLVVTLVLIVLTVCLLAITLFFKRRELEITIPVMLVHERDVVLRKESSSQMAKEVYGQKMKAAAAPFATAFVCLLVVLLATVLWPNGQYFPGIYIAFSGVALMVGICSTFVAYSRAKLLTAMVQNGESLATEKVLGFTPQLNGH